ncbi:hypothetical protein CLG96_09490 [Sphingomonas oleivorans]|uniref:Uncharacterized protein n=2 Tax=Sphingomonas oleivorans TaxID=1735121 RepID=A0A2T5FYL8_9SPHN|nr:hypothetical protein CLG96_09490 [Sphingomonas oleivorans]
MVIGRFLILLRAALRFTGKSGRREGSFRPRRQSFGNRPGLMSGSPYRQFGPDRSGRLHRQRIRKLLRDFSGSTIFKYGPIATLIAIFAISVLQSLESKRSLAFHGIAAIADRSYP